MTGLKQILVLLKPFKRQLLTALGLTGILTFIGMAPPLLIRRLVDDVAKQGQWGIFPLVIALLVAVPLLRALFNIGNAMARHAISMGIMAKTRKQLFRRLMRLSMDFYDRTPVGSITQRTLGDVGTVSGVMTGGIIELMADAIAVVFAVVVMLRLSPSLALLTFALLPFYLLNFWFFTKRIHRSTSILRSRMDHISSMLQERLAVFSGYKPGAC